MLHVASSRKDATSCFSVAFLHWDVARSGHAACRAACSMRCVLHVVCCRLLLLHLLCCIVSAARCIVRVGCRCRQRATMRRARVQRFSGGVLIIDKGSATFESVAISDTAATSVRAAWEADRAGTEAEFGWRCAERWRGEDG
jgi:hypothetical protein